MSDAPRPDLVREQVRICHNQGRIVGTGANCYKVGIELGDVDQEILVSPEFVHDQIDGAGAE